MIKKPSHSRAAKASGQFGVVENCQRAVRLELRSLGRFLNRVNREIGLGKDCVFVRFVTDAEMKRLNRTFRGKNRTTDVLSFHVEARLRPIRPGRRATRFHNSFLGDIAIAPRVARRNAMSIGRTISFELQILILHGVLHLLGYDHETDQGEMERMEDRLRERLGLLP